MASPDQEPVISLDTGDRDADVLEGGSRPYLPRHQVAWFTAAALLLGGVLGYVVGVRRPDRPATPRVAASPAGSPSPSGTQPLQATGARCGRQIGKQLQLGVEVRNASDATVTLMGLDANLPLPGLHPASRSFGPCDQLPPAPVRTDLAAHGTGWLTLVLDVQVPCPAPLPVSFAVLYRSNGASDIQDQDVPGFVDLGAVPYSGCPGS